MSISIARRYAKAMVAIAHEEQSLEATEADLQHLAALAAHPDLAPLLANPLLSAENRKRLASTLADHLGLRPVTRNFFFLLADHQRLAELAAIADHYRRLVDQALGRLRARITSAVELDADQERNLIAVLERKTGRTVLADRRVDPELLAGVVVAIEGTVYDGSLRTQLQRLAATIAGHRSYL